MTAVNCSTPNFPRFETEKVPPLMSASLIFPARAFPVNSWLRLAISFRERNWHPLMTGIRRPWSKATAIPMLMSSWVTMASSWKAALTSGNLPMATAAAFTTRSFKENGAPASRSSWRTRSPSPISIATVTVKWGIVRHASATVRAMALRIRDSGSPATGPRAATPVPPPVCGRSFPTSAFCSGA